MAPEAEAYVGGGGGKVCLKAQRLPGDYRVSGKACGVAVTAQTAIAGKDQTPFSVAAIVYVMMVIEQPKGVHSRNGATSALLPVDPPMVHTPLFQGVHQMLKVGFGKGGIGQIKDDGLVACRIHSVCLCHHLVRILTALHAVGGMEV